MDFSAGGGSAERQDGLSKHLELSSRSLLIKLWLKLYSYFLNTLSEHTAQRNHQIQKALLVRQDFHPLERSQHCTRSASETSKHLDYQALLSLDLKQCSDSENPGQIEGCRVNHKPGV